MQLHAEQLSVEQALDEFIAVAFSTEERQIAKLKSRLEGLPPRSEARVIIMREMMEVRLKQLGTVLG